MLKPTKHLNPDLSVLNVAAHTLRLLATHRTMDYDELYLRLEKKLGDDLRPVFLPAVSFLYLLGKIEYHTKNDTFEYRTP
jgi:ABC-3C biological conflict system middle component